VNVDVATYKAEFMSHYYEKRARPKVAYALGLAHEWTRVGARAPLLANLAAAAGRRAAGIAPQREMPKIAKETFRAWYAKHGPRPQGRGSGRPRVLLWPDTFNDHYYPETLRAGLGVLGAAGFDVGIPKQDVCCGRPLYDYGFLDRAKKLLLEDVAALRSEIQAGTPLVGLEPSCVAVFRDELPNLLHGNEDAERLSKQTFTLAEVLEQAAAPPRFQMEEPLIVHGHCHQKAVMGMGAEQRILSRWGARFEIADTGCCGLAGSFGFEAAKFDLSMAIGEQVLFPLVRRADADTVLVADGFSCREQIRQGTGRHALHLAEALARGCGV
jgi:Fe-S oxidoreductase